MPGAENPASFERRRLGTKIQPEPEPTENHGLRPYAVRGSACYPN
jgi:hypothetical protein